MKEKDLFWLSFCSLFGAWKIVGMAFLCLDLVPLSETVFPFVQSAVTARVNLSDPQISTRKDQIFSPLHRQKMFPLSKTVFVFVKPTVQYMQPHPVLVHLD